MYIYYPALIRSQYVCRVYCVCVCVCVLCVCCVCVLYVLCVLCVCVLCVCCVCVVCVVCVCVCYGNVASDSSFLCLLNGPSLVNTLYIKHS